MTVQLDARPPTAWRYRWRITLTRRTNGMSNTTTEHTFTVTSPDELCDVILHTSYDPTIVAYTYHRYTAPPIACPTCGEPYTDTTPNQQWQACACGGHLVTSCTACGEAQAHP